MLPWRCFHLPTSASSSAAAKPTNSSPAIRLISPDGRVKVLEHPVQASEVMRQHPLHLICRSDSFIIGQRVPAIPPTDRLQPGHSYFLLPSHFFHSVLSFVSLYSFLLTNTTTTILRGFDISKTDSGMLQVRIKDELISKENNVINSDHDQEKKKSSSSSSSSRLRVCNSDVLEKEYQQLVGHCSARRWRPRLETVTEGRSSCVVMLQIRRRKKKKVTLRQ